jgi:hypothetical protein
MYTLPCPASFEHDSEWSTNAMLHHAVAHPFTLRWPSDSDALPQDLLYVEITLQHEPLAESEMRITI